MKFVSTLLLFLFTFATAFGQTTVPPKHNHTNKHRCGLDERTEELIKKHPELADKYRNYQQYIEEILPQLKKNQDQNRSQASIVVPVVFHVIHSGEGVGSGQNIPESTILAQLQTLNEDFQAMNADFGSTPTRFSGAIGNPDIQFCLAQVDPQGQPTTGITRDQFTNVTDASIENLIKPSTIWNSLNYFNIWTLPIPGTTNQGGTTGYAYFPSAAGADFDGAVLDYRFTGADESTLTHEAGHYFGLPHLWGNGGCGPDDGFADTPQQSEPTSDSGWFSCASNYPPGPNTCGEEHMYVNYMDYASDGCLTSFTQDQITLMRAVLMGTAGNVGSRAGLVASAATVATSCESTGGGGGTNPTVFLNDAGVVNIVTPSESSCADEEVIPVINLQNQFGENTLTSCRIRYRINGANGPIYNWSGSLEKGESEEVPLPSFTTPNGDYTFVVTASNPNSQSDEWGLNDDEEVNIAVNVPQLAPLLDDFETNTFAPTASGMMAVNYSNDAFEWKHNAFASGFGAGTGSAYFDNFNDNGISTPNNTEDGLVTPPLDFTNLANAELSFDVAYAPYSPDNMDGLEVRVSTDCGVTFTDQLYFKEGNELNTTGGYVTFDFQPMDNQWRKEIIDLSAYSGMSTVSIAFVNHSGYGNYLYLDNVNIGTGCIASVGVQSQNASCSDACDGAIQLDINGFDEAYTVTWSNNAGASGNAESLSDLCIGNYDVTVTDGNACEFIRTVELTDLPDVETNDVAQNISCNGACDGSIQLDLSGFEQPYTVVWGENVENQISQESANNLCAGTYEITITQPNGCSSIKTFELTEPEGIGTSSYAFGETGVGANDGSAGVFGILIGTLDFTYTWSHGPTTPEVTDLAPGDYTVTITAAGEDCPTIETITIDAFTCDEFVATITSQNVTCNGGFDGEICIELDGGSPPYFYEWSNFFFGPCHTNFPAGTHTVTARDSKGCILVETITIEEPDELELNVVITPESAMNASDASIMVTPLGGTPDYTYMWSTGSTSNQIINLFPATYGCTVTDAAGCTTSEQIEVTATVCSSFDLSTSSTDVTCNGAANGTATVNIGAAGDFGITWNTGNTTNTADNLAPGTYTVEVTDGGECSETLEVVINEPDVLTIDMNTTNVACNGDNSGTAAVMVAGGMEPYSYTWSDELSINSTNTINNVMAGTYSVTVNDMNGCSEIAVFEITEPAGLQTESTSTSTCFGAENGSATVTVLEGTPPYAYNWDNGMIFPTINDLAVGIHDLTITDGNGCQTLIEVEVTANNEMEIDLATTNESIENAADGAITPTISGGVAPYTYMWSDGSTTETIENGTPGTYSLTITDANGCIASTEIVEILAGENPCSLFNSNTIQTNISCFGAMDGAFEILLIEGSAPYNIVWDADIEGLSAENLAAGTYAVTILDAMNCPMEQTITINEPSPLTAAVGGANETYLNYEDGIATVTPSGGTAPYTYLWSNAAETASISGLAADTYEVTITDVNGCVIVSSITIGEGINPCLNFAMEYESTSISCTGESDGSITLLPTNGTEPFNFTINGEPTTTTISDLSAGVYVILTSDAFDCINELEIEITEPTPITVEFDVTDESQEDANDGSATVTIEGGTSDYSVIWSNGATTTTIIDLMPGDYTATITDGNACQFTETVTIAEGNNLCIGFSAAFDIDPVTCFGESNGQISLALMGGLAPYNYTWSDGTIESEQLSGLTAGTYMVTITDENSCDLVVEMEVPQPDLLVVTATAENETVLDFNDGTISLEVVGGTTPYTYNWNNNETTSALENLAPGEYSVEVVDGNGCQETATITIEAGVDLCAAYMATISATNVSCFGGTDGTLAVLVEGGMEPYSFSWNNDLENVGELTGLSAGFYEALVTDANNCEIVVQIELTEPEELGVTVETSNETAPNANDATISLNVTGGTPDYTYVWNTGETTATINSLPAGDYTTTITDSQGCAIEINIPVFLNNPDCTGFDAIFQIQSISCAGETDGIVEVVPTGGVSPYNVEWMNVPSLNGTLVENLAAGSYQVVITDAVNCIAEYNVVVPAPQEMSLELVASDGYCGGGGFAQAVVLGGTPPFEYTWDNGETNATLLNLTEGQYAVSVTDANGCMTQGMAAIQTESNNVEFMISSDAVTCTGNNDGMIMVEPVSGNEPFEYEWNNGATANLIENLSPGVYTVFVTDGNGCVFGFSEEVLEPSPMTASIGFDNNGSGICNVQGGSGPYNYNWSDGTTTAYNNMVFGNDYLVTVTDENGCTALAEMNTTSVAGIDDLVELNIFPNPTTDVLFVQAELAQQQTLRIRLFNLVGQEVYTTQSNTTSINTQINTADLSAGTYFLRMSTNTGQLSRKIVVLK